MMQFVRQMRLLPLTIGLLALVLVFKTIVLTRAVVVSEGTGV